jgi:dTDP-4-dehydrorhamnose reductase
MVSVLVTGSKGQLGLTFQDLTLDFPEVSFDFKASKELDITQRDQIAEAFRKGNYNFCINCAAFTNVEVAEKNPEEAFKVNAEGVKNLALVCKEHGVALMQISTDYVFDGEKEGAYSAQDIPNPINEYGKSKLKGEEYIKAILPNKHYILRTSWLYSKKHGHNFYKTILKKAQSGEELYITDAQRGCPTNSEALARFILNEIVLGDKPFGTYHFADGKPMTWYEFAKQILEENGLMKTTKLVLDTNYRTLAKRPKNSVLR